eukprot:1354721-Amorphochlora_amoeboformis.AAC.2
MKTLPRRPRGVEGRRRIREQGGVSQLKHTWNSERSSGTMAAVAAQAEEVKMGLQRHINLLRDPNKVKRRRYDPDIRVNIRGHPAHSECDGGSGFEYIRGSEGHVDQTGRNVKNWALLWVGVLKDIFYEKLAPSLVAALQVRDE